MDFLLRASWPDRALLEIAVLHHFPKGLMCAGLRHCQLFRGSERLCETAWMTDSGHWSIRVSLVYSTGSGCLAKVLHVTYCLLEML